MNNLRAILTAIGQKIGDFFLPFEDRGYDRHVKRMSKELVAVCVGHSRSGDDGAVSVDGVSEWAYNDELATMVCQWLRISGVASFKVNNYEGKSYGAAMRWVSGEVEKRHASLAVELHFNASDSPTAHGHEWLYWADSFQSRRLAERLRDAHALEFPALRSRGAVPKKSGDRGAEFLRLTHCPAVICEPFFGTTPEEWKHATKHKQDIARAISEGIRAYLEP